MAETKEKLGLVKNASFLLADTDNKNPMFLTTVRMQEARTPESGQIDLQQYEGNAIMVSFQAVNERWIYGANIIEVSGPILTQLVKKVYGIK